MISVSRSRSGSAFLFSPPFLLFSRFRLFFSFSSRALFSPLPFFLRSLFFSALFFSSALCARAPFLLFLSPPFLLFSLSCLFLLFFFLRRRPAPGFLFPSKIPIAVFDMYPVFWTPGIGGTYHFRYGVLLFWGRGFFRVGFCLRVMPDSARKEVCRAREFFRPAPRRHRVETRAHDTRKADAPHAEAARRHKDCRNGEPPSLCPRE